MVEFKEGYIMPKITTTELVKKVYMFCEAYSGVQLFPYQQQFALRIIRSVLENDGEEITALFSRQCVAKGSLVTMEDGSKKPIEEVKVGEKVLAFDYSHFVPREVTHSYCTGTKEVYRLRLRSGQEIVCTGNHRFLDKGSRLFKPLFEFESGDEIAYVDTKTHKRRFSRIKSIVFMGEVETYDIEVESAENFLCNNILTHNSGKSETVSTICGGLAIILPTLANTPMFMTDKRLNRFKDGIMIGCFAPTLRQAQIVFNRMKKRMGSKHAQEILGDPEINVTFDVSNGQNVVLSNGSLISSQSASEGSNIEGDSYMLIIVDESQDVGNFKYSKSISPMGAFYNATKILIGTATTQRGFFLDSIERNQAEHKSGGKRNHFQYDYRTVMKYNANYEKYIKGEMKRLGENSDEFQMSYNLKWILERGMFIDDKHFSALASPEMGLSIMDTSKNHVAGIDLGKKHDSTVVTILEVDWNNPIVVEKAQSGDMDIPDYTAYNVYVKAWLEIQGDDWNEQYEQIKDFLIDFNVCRVVMDATGVGDAIYDRLRANLDCEVIPFVFSKQGKSDLYKHLNTEIRAVRVHYPADPETLETREYQNFEAQFLDLQKSYSGQLMIVAHPDVAGAHDDYPDSLALAVWGAKGDPVAKPETEKNPWHDRTNKSFGHSRNSITARRR